MEFRRIDLNKESSYIGIYEIIDNQLYVLLDSIDEEKAVNDVIDGGYLFHIDLVKLIVKNYNKFLTSKTLNEIKKSNYKNWTSYPRGRITYDIKEKKFTIWGPLIILKNKDIVNKIINEFNLPNDKLILCEDIEYRLD